MKSAFIVTNSRHLQSTVERVLGASGGSTGDGFSQLIDDQHRMLNIERLHPEEYAEWDIFEPFSTVHGDSSLPDIVTASICYVECRWEEMFIYWALRIAAQLDDTLWVLDSNGGMWRSDTLDPETLCL